MITPDFKKKVARLRAQIDELRHRYHVLNDPEVTDAMYDGLMDELRRIEAEHPEIVTPDSPTQRVAGKPLDRFEKVVHTVPQWSFNDAFCREDLEDWQERILKILEKKLGRRPADLTYICELKIDGLHIVLTYEAGRLHVAATRGDGRVGEDVTQNIKTIQSVPLVLKKPVSLVAEGEVWLSAAMLEKINAERKKSGEPIRQSAERAPDDPAARPPHCRQRSFRSRRMMSSRTSFPPSGGEGGLIPGKRAFLLKDLVLRPTATESLQTIDEIMCWEYWQKQKRAAILD